MTRAFYYWDKETNKFVEIKPEQKKVDAPMVLPDEIPPTQSMIDETPKMFTSRSALRNYYKANGYEVTGGEHFSFKTPEPKIDPQDIRNDAEKAYMDIKYDRVPFTEKEKELCLRERRMEQEYKKRNHLR